MQLDDPAGQRQPQAQAAPAPIEAPVRAGERLVQPLQDVGGDAHAGVADRPASPGGGPASETTSSVTEPPRPVCFTAFSSRASATRRSRPASAQHPDRGGGQRQGQGHPGPIRVGAAGLDRLAADLAQVHVLRLQRDQAAGQPGDLQDVVDDPREAVDLAIHQLVQVGGEPGIARPSPQQVQAVADRRQGIAQLVGHQAEQLVLAARGIGQPPDLLLQLELAACGLGQVAETWAKPRTSPAGPRRAVIVTSAQNREPSLRTRHPCSHDRPAGRRGVQLGRPAVADPPAGGLQPTRDGPADHLVAG